MVDLTVLQIFWTVLLGLAVACFGFYASQGSYYDKTGGQRDPEKPHGWFQFKKRLALYYFIGLIWSLWLLWNVVWMCSGSSPSQGFAQKMDYFAGPGSRNVEGLHGLVALILFTIHMGRRYYESLSVSVFSNHQAYNPIQAILNIVFFPACAMSVIADGEFETACFRYDNLSWRMLVAVVVFIWASRLSRSTYSKLARLRKNKAGHVVTSAHKMPKGDWFDVVTCPNYFAEVVVYLCLALLLGSQATTFLFMLAYIVVDHIFMAHSTRSFYFAKYEDYPRNVKLLIPYLL